VKWDGIATLAIPLFLTIVAKIGLNLFKLFHNPEQTNCGLR
jgi:hypothetical protein